MLMTVEPKTVAPKQPQEQIAHYCIVRRDIPFGAQAAQLIHAAGESSPGRLGEGTFAIALHAKDEAHLRAISAQLTLEGIVHKCIVEDAAPYSGQLMAIGCTPGPRWKISKHMSNLPLVRDEERCSICKCTYTKECGCE